MENFSFWNYSFLVQFLIVFKSTNRCTSFYKRCYSWKDKHSHVQFLNSWEMIFKLTIWNQFLDHHWTILTLYEDTISIILRMWIEIQHSNKIQDSFQMKKNHLKLIIFESNQINKYLSCRFFAKSKKCELFCFQFQISLETGNQE
jgi:hypothetical protein